MSQLEQLTTKRRSRIKHGAAVGNKRTPEYSSWQSMRARCHNPNAKRYERYGGRGIRVCEAWSDFAQFLRDMGPRPKGHTLERKNNDGNYEPTNCKWATPKEQQNNTCLTVYVEHDGKRQTLAQWSDETGVSLVALRARYDRGWSIDQMLNPDTDRSHHKRPSNRQALRTCAAEGCKNLRTARLCRRHSRMLTYRQARATGLCVVCRQPSGSDQTKCTRCCEYHQEQNRAYRLRQKGNAI